MNNSRLEYSRPVNCSIYYSGRGNHMKKAIFILTMVIFLLSASLCFAASPVPNLVGTWEDKSEKTVLVKGDKPGWQVKKITVEIKITEQKGRVIYGEAAAPNGTEKITGIISPDNKRVACVDEDGFIDLKITSTDEMMGVHRHVLQGECAVVSGVWTRKTKK
jgi:hypothetical protein